MGIINQIRRAALGLLHYAEASNKDMNSISAVRVQRPEPSPVLRHIDRKHFGDEGRLEISDLDISVPLYSADGKDAQAIVDRQDSAAYLHWGSQTAIADHASQANFRRLNQAKVGETIAEINRNGRPERYRCIDTQVGHIQTIDGKNRIYDVKWAPVFEQNAGGLTIYTCLQRSAQDVMDIRLTYWERISEAI